MIQRLLAPLVGFAFTLAGACADQSVAERFRASPSDADVIAAGNWYRPLARVEGSHGAAGARIGNLDDSAAPAAEAARFAPLLADLTAWDSLAVVVVQHARIVFEHYTAPGGPEFRFDSQSMHRAILALVTGVAIADGHIRSLDAPAALQLTEWRGDRRAAISVRDLLYEQAGFVDPPYSPTIDSPSMQMFIGRDLAGLVLARQPVSAPGVAWRGSTVDGQLLGLVIERATREPYASYLSSRLWQPIGASTAYVRLDRPGGHARTFCCIQATARDWARVGQLMLDQGRVGGRQVVPRAWIAQLLTPSTLNPTFGGFWVLAPTPLGPRSGPAGSPPPTPAPFAAPGVFYGGGRGGQRVYVIPSLDAVVVRFGRIRGDFDDAAFLNPVLQALHHAPDPGSS
jgi:CubicO group peptidase (beta-lactamase class C family)